MLLFHPTEPNTSVDVHGSAAVSRWVAAGWLKSDPATPNTGDGDDNTNEPTNQPADPDKE